MKGLVQKIVNVRGKLENILKCNEEKIHDKINSLSEEEKRIMLSQCICIIRNGGEENEN